MSLRLLALAAVALALASARPASADDGCREDDCSPNCHHHGHCHHHKHLHQYRSDADNAAARMRAQGRPWHGGFYHTMWGQPIALVVPPTAEYESNYRWGVGGTTVTPIDHQFGRAYPGNNLPRRYGFLATPQWPSDTRQFGVYYVRGPW